MSSIKIDELIRTHWNTPVSPRNIKIGWLFSFQRAKKHYNKKRIVVNICFDAIGCFFVYRKYVSIFNYKSLFLGTFL